MKFYKVKKREGVEIPSDVDLMLDADQLRRRKNRLFDYKNKPFLFRTTTPVSFKGGEIIGVVSLNVDVSNTSFFEETTRKEFDEQIDTKIERGIIIAKVNNTVKSNDIVKSNDKSKSVRPKDDSKRRVGKRHSK